MTTDVARQPSTPHEIEITDDQVELLKNTICKGSTNDELQLFLATSRRLGLDPFSRQIHAVKRKERFKDDATGRWGDREVMTIQVGIDGFRLQAQRSGRYGGQEGPWWCGTDGVWREIWPWDAPPAAAKVVVLLHGAGGIVRVPAVAHWREYVSYKHDGSPTKMWASKASLMLAKCAEALALRKAFPAELSGLYTPDEMQAADGPSAAAQVQAPPPAAAEQADADDRPCRIALREVFRGRGLGRDEIEQMTHAALDDAGAPAGADLDKRLRMSPDSVIEAAAALLDTPVVDAQVVDEAAEAPTDDQLAAFEEALDDPPASATAAAIQGDS